MALTFTISPLPAQLVNYSQFVYRQHFVKIANSSHSNSNKNSHIIRSQKVKGKNSSAQSGASGFAALEAFKIDKITPKNIVSKPQKNEPQSMQNNEEKKHRIARQGNRAENPRIPSSEDSDLKKNEDVLHLNSRANPEPSLRGEDIIWALQKASAQRANEEGRRKGKKKNANRVDSTRRGSSKTTPRVVGNVRPITVKTEWAARIESLEIRLKELKERAELS